MIDKVLNDTKFIKMMKEHCHEILEFLIQQKIEFSIIVNPKFTDFAPPLPPHLDLSKEPFTRFILGGYTFESIDLSQDKLEFHAGFGAEDYATFVSVDMGAISQIIVEDAILFVNFSFYKRPTHQVNSKALAQNSKNIFLNNPKNKEKFTK